IRPRQGTRDALVRLARRSAGPRMPESSRAEARKKRGAAGRRSAGRGLRLASTALVATAAGLAPLLAGTVHRPSILAILIVVALAFACGIAGERVRGGALRGSSYALPFWIALVLPLAQLVPLPVAARRIVDPGG